MSDVFSQKFDTAGPKYRFLTLGEIREIVGYDCSVGAVCDELNTEFLNEGFLCPAQSLNYLERPESKAVDILDRLNKTYDQNGVHAVRPLSVVLGDINYPDVTQKFAIQMINRFAKNTRNLRTRSGPVFLMPPLRVPERWIQHLAARTLLAYKTTTREVSLHELALALGGSFESALDMIRVRAMIDAVGSFTHDDEYERIRFPWVG